jgi:hypothetical protein
LALCLPLTAESLTQDLMVRLTTPIDSMAPAGTPVGGIVIGCLRADCAPILPVGSYVDGIVHRVYPVGFGLRRERSSVVLRFTGCRLPDGTPADCRPELLSVDNGRENVSKGNRIQGVLAADHPHSVLSGVWFRPSSAVFTRSISGLNGAGRMIYSDIAQHPLLAGAIVVTRLAFLRLPDPEIHIPPGAELVLRVSGEARAPANESRLDAGLAPAAGWLSSVPVRVTAGDGGPVADIINLAFQGSAGDISAAFLGAGWSTADPLNARTFARSYKAFTQMAPYPTAPVSPLRYEGRLPDLVFQKSLNCMAKRHHIRLWRVESPHGPLWLGAATHDIGIAFDWKRVTLTHRIDREVDRERDKVLADLSFAGCVKHSVRVERPELAVRNARLATDGALWFMESGSCQAPAYTGPRPGRWRKASLPRVIVRRTLLETRHYVLRGNAYYWMFRGLRSQARSVFPAREK